MIEKTKKSLSYLIFFSVFFLQMLDNFIREYHSRSLTIGAIKNGLLAFYIAVFIVYIYKLKSSKKYNFIFGKELTNVVTLTGVFSIISLYYIIINNGFKMATVEGLIHLLLPIFTAYVMLNTLHLDEIYSLMSNFLIIMFLGYIIINLDNFNIETIKAISFLESSSAFESNHFSPAAMGFCLFFCYYRKNKLLTALSVIFVLMTFKRLMIIWAIFLFVFGKYLSRFSKKMMVPRWITFLFASVFFVICIIYIQLMSGEIEDLIYKYLGVEANIFVSGRAVFMRRIIKNFTSYGFMSSTVIENFQPMEMDIPMIYVEMGVLAVIATICCYIRFINNNWYNFFLVIFSMMELLTSHWFDVTFYWVLAYVTLGCISYKSNKIEMTSKYKKSLSSKQH